MDLTQRDALDYRFVRAAQPLIRALQWFHPTRVEGAHLLPEGPALLVGNHGLLGYETLLFFESIYSSLGRVPRGLADRWFFEVPVVRDLLVRLGGVHGTRENARRVLRDGHLAVCYPGGAREVLKYHHSDRYRLRWEKSAGFVRIALELGVPVVPFAAAGVDDTYTIVKRLRGTGRLLMGHDKYDLPFIVGIGPFPTPVPFWFRIDEPVQLEGAHDDEDAVAHWHRHLWARTQRLLDDTVMAYRAHRARERRERASLEPAAEGTR
jgi:1-acyl-sn-glycerol-3-phosphate acyltransferase